MSEVFDPTNSECRVYVRRTGLLAAVGHDLELRVAAYRIDVDRLASRVSAQFDARSLRVVDAIEGRQRRPGKLSVKDKAQIEAAIAAEVLDAARHPTIGFESIAIEARDDEHHVHGRLTLRGVARELRLVAVQHADRLSAHALVHQPAFAITPYRAVGGALRVHADVTIEFGARVRAQHSSELA